MFPAMTFLSAKRRAAIPVAILATAGALLVVASFAIVTPARAQFGNLFGPPRPPDNVPQQQPQADPDEDDVPDLPEGGRVLPVPMPQQQQQPGRGVPPPGSFSSQPLPPPPGTRVAPAQPAQQQPAQQQPQQPAQNGAPNAPAAANALPGLPPGQRQPRTPPGTTPPAPAATLQPGDEIVTEPPKQKIVNNKAVFSGLDKITGRIINFDEDVGETVQFGALRVKTDACYTRPATEAANTDAFVEVEEITLQGEVKKIFSGWMFAASPGLHGVEHPIYDVWLTDCKDPQNAPVAVSDPPKPAAPAPAPTQPQKRAAPPPRPPAQRAPAPLPPFQQQ